MIIKLIIENILNDKITVLHLEWDRTITIYSKNKMNTIPAKKKEGNAQVKF